MKPGWRRVTKARPCPVCARPNKEHGSHYCLVSDDGEAAICPFTPEGAKRNLGQAGYLHSLRNADYPRDRAVRPKPPPECNLARVLDWNSLAAFYEAAVQEADLARLGASLGVTPASLQRLRAGLCGPETWSFPMTNSEGRILGIRIRHETGKKWAVTGTRDGLFVPRDLNGAEPLVLCEGPTDTAAMLDLELSAIGRSNCHPWSELIVPLAAGRAVVIVSDTDDVGRGGAVALRDALKDHCRDVRIVTPVGAKDARAWKNNGLTREQFLEVAYGNGNY